MEKVDLRPDQEELSDRVTHEPLERLKAVLVSSAAVLSRNKADLGRCK